jgi:hypothetical protein
MHGAHGVESPIVPDLGEFDVTKMASISIPYIKNYKISFVKKNNLDFFL